MAVVKLLTAQTIDTDGSQTMHVSTGGHALLIIWGEFDGAEVRPEVAHNPDEEGWLTIRDTVGKDITLTKPVNDEHIIYLPPNLRIRLAVTKAGPLTNLNAKFLG